ncbi:MAG: polysaccharide pyruvyl transferase family protein, partial [Paracoccaceae bacterium]
MKISVFRKDRKNVGDWYSTPVSFLPLLSVKKFDLAHPETIPNEPGIVVLGGGGLGRPEFAPFLQKLLRDDRKYRVIAWGVGSDTLTTKGRLLAGRENMQDLMSYFEGMDEVGTRIDRSLDIDTPENYHWVPCASCLSDQFETLRETPIVRQVGVYEHLRESVTQHLPIKSRTLNRLTKGIRFHSNRGTDLHSKLRFMAESEYVFTNSYHGVYWATLLGRKAVCFPFKNGLFTFRHPPAFVDND